MERKSLRDEIKIEKYWTSKLVEWRGRSLHFQIRHHFCEKLVRDSIRLVMNISIGVQVLFVSAGKLVLFLSARFGNAVLSCFCTRLGFQELCSST